MTRTFRSEFPDFTDADIPAELLDTANWTDMSWHNELCPRFASVDTVQSLGKPYRVCVWVEKLDPSDREDDSLPRFSVSLVTPDDCDVPDAWASTDSIDAETWPDVLAAVTTITAR